MNRTRSGHVVRAALTVPALWLVAAATGAELAASPVVQAQAHGQPSAERGQGQRMGAGGDAASEATRRQRRMMQMLDQDGDGTLSHEEFVETPRPGAGANTEQAVRRRDARFEQLDADDDGRLSAAELTELGDGTAP